jgi:hypothetical protein
MSAEDDRYMKSTEPKDPRDVALERAWRDTSQEQPSAGLDARILAAARAAIDEAPGSARRESTRRNVLQRWQPLLAAAAVAGLAFVLVPMTLSPPATERATAPATAPAMESADTAPAYDEEVTGSPRAAHDGGAERMMQSEPPVPRIERAQAIPERVPELQRESRATKASPAVTVPPPPAAATTGSSAPAETSNESDPAGAGSFGARPSMPPRPDAQRVEQAISTLDSSAAAGPPAMAREKRAADPGTIDETHRWIERIESAYQRGDLATAAAELRTLRTIDPTADDRLPDELRDWARTVD